MEGTHPYRSRFLWDFWASKENIIHSNDFQIESLLWNMYMNKMIGNGELGGQDEALQIAATLPAGKSKFRCALYITSSVTMLNKTSRSKVVTVMEVRNVYL